MMVNSSPVSDQLPEWTIPVYEDMRREIGREYCLTNDELQLLKETGRYARQNNSPLVQIDGLAKYIRDSKRTDFTLLGNIITTLSGMFSKLKDRTTGNTKTVMGYCAIIDTTASGVPSLVALKEKERDVADVLRPQIMEYVRSFYKSDSGYHILSETGAFPSPHSVSKQFHVQTHEIHEDLSRAVSPKDLTMEVIRDNDQNGFLTYVQISETGMETIDILLAGNIRFDSLAQQILLPHLPGTEDNTTFLQVLTDLQNDKSDVALSKEQCYSWSSRLQQIMKSTREQAYHTDLYVPQTAALINRYLINSLAIITDRKMQEEKRRLDRVFLNQLLLRQTHAVEATELLQQKRTPDGPTYQEQYRDVDGLIDLLDLSPDEILPFVMELEKNSKRFLFHRWRLLDVLQDEIRQEAEHIRDTISRSWSQIPHDRPTSLSQLQIREESIRESTRALLKRIAKVRRNVGIATLSEMLFPISGDVRDYEVSDTDLFVSDPKIKRIKIQQYLDYFLFTRRSVDRSEYTLKPWLELLSIDYPDLERSALEHFLSTQGNTITATLYFYFAPYPLLSFLCLFLRAFLRKPTHLGDKTKKTEGDTGGASHHSSLTRKQLRELNPLLTNEKQLREKIQDAEDRWNHKIGPAKKEARENVDRFVRSQIHHKLHAGTPHQRYEFQANDFTPENGSIMAERIINRNTALKAIVNQSALQQYVYLTALSERYQHLPH